MPFIDIAKRQYLICCRDGNYRGNKHTKRLSTKKRPLQKSSRKINQHCLAGMYVDYFKDGHLEVIYISAHFGHKLGPSELPYLPLPKSTKQTVALKLSQGIPAERIIEGLFLCSYYVSLLYYVDEREGVGNRCNRTDFLQNVSRKHFLTKQDVANVSLKVKDSLVMRHKSDPISVSLYMYIGTVDRLTCVLFIIMSFCIINRSL